MAGYVNSSAGEVDSINTNTTEVNDDSKEVSTDKIIPQEREGETSTNEIVEVSGEDMGTEAAEESLFGLKTTSEIAADDTKDVGEFQPESASEISDEGYFTGAAEASNSSTDAKLHVIDDTSDTAHNDNKQSTPESLDASTQTEAAPVSVMIDKDAQTIDGNSNSLEHETVYPAASEDKVATKAVESEPSRAAENDEIVFTSISEQQHLAVQFDAVGADKSAITGSIDNSGTKASVYIQSSEINIDITPDYNNFVESTDSVNNERLVDKIGRAHV